jgi:signal transduction histidine kinase
MTIDPNDGPADVGGVQDDTGDLRLGLVRAMMWAAVGLIMLIRLLSAQQAELPWWSALAAMAPYPPILGLLAGPHRRRTRIILLLSLVLLYALPFMLVGVRWQWLPWPLAVAALCALPGRVGWPLFALILAVTDVAGLRSGQDALTALVWTYKTANDGLIVFGLYALAVMVAQLHATRGELARLQVLGERRRLGGELQIVVGTRLRVLGRQLAQAASAEPDADPQVVHDRLGAAVETARLALADIRQAAGAYRIPESEPSAISAPFESPRVARLTLAAIYVFNALIQVVTAQSDYHRPWTMFLLIPLLAVSGAVLLRPSRRQVVLLTLLLVPTALPLGYVIWELGFLSSMWPFLMGVVLISARRPLSWIFVGVAVALDIALFFYPPPVPNLAGMAADLTSLAILTWVTYSLIRLSGLVAVLHQARRDLAREALVRERSRVARDLHDVLSFSLWSVALQGELCQQLLESDPGHAREQLARLPALAERALAELDAVAHSSPVLRTDAEVDAARIVLETAGILPAMTVHVGPLSAGLDAALAAALREAVTNVVRHSQARHCAITIASSDGLVRLRVVNDGVHRTPAPADGSQRRGTGLAGLAERTGGRVAAGPLPEGRFELVAEFAAAPVGAS